MCLYHFLKLKQLLKTISPTVAILRDRNNRILTVENILNQGFTLGQFFLIFRFPTFEVVEKNFFINQILQLFFIEPVIFELKLE